MPDKPPPAESAGMELAAFAVQITVHCEHQHDDTGEEVSMQELVKTHSDPDDPAFVGKGGWSRSVYQCRRCGERVVVRTLARFDPPPTR
jgi:hypothetical protein